MLIKNILTVFLVSSSFFFVSAQSNEDLAVRQQCFSTLKENMKEASIFSVPLQTLATTTYADLSLKFGEKKKMLFLFDLGIDKNLLGFRLYSFGRQTAYTYPQKSLFPISTKSDTWGDPVKEYIVGEEYVTDSEGKDHFLDCLFLQISGENLMNLKENTVEYDGAQMSLMKESSDGSYKASYVELPSFDYQDKLLVTWNRLIVYPKATSNSYFSRYDIADAYVANKVKSFDILNFFLQKNILKIDDYNVKTGTSTIKYFVKNDLNNMTEVSPPTLLLPISPSGVNRVFPYASYYQAIENQFPEFASLLSISGTLKYSTFKKLVSERNSNKEVLKFFNEFWNNKPINSYYLRENKLSVSIKEYDRIIPLLQNADWTVDKLLNGSDFDTLRFNPYQEEAKIVPFFNVKIVIFILFGILLSILGIIVFLKKRKLSSNSNII